VVLCAPKGTLPGEASGLPHAIGRFERAEIPPAQVEPPRDDWPYLYLSERAIPEDYLIVIATLIAVSLACVLLLRPGRVGLAAGGPAVLDAAGRPAARLLRGPDLLDHLPRGAGPVGDAGRQPRRRDRRRLRGVPQHDDGARGADAAGHRDIRGERGVLFAVQTDADVSNTTARGRNRSGLRI